MADHDPMCAMNRPEEDRDDDGCTCFLIASVRADERALIGRVWAKREDLRDAHAEAVAARLVEVICEMQAEADEEDAYFLTSYQRIRTERDAARAEVAALREQYVVEEFIDTDGYPSMRVVKGEHVGENEWAANIRRSVLADLRAKVEGLHRAVIDGEPHIQRGEVLALIEEAGR